MAEATLANTGERKRPDCCRSTDRPDRVCDVITPRMCASRALCVEKEREHPSIVHARGREGREEGEGGGTTGSGSRSGIERGAEDGRGTETKSNAERS